MHDGSALTADRIIAPEVGIDQADTPTFHDSFQDPDKFLAAGSRCSACSCPKKGMSMVTGPVITNDTDPPKIAAD